MQIGGARVILNEMWFFKKGFKLQESGEIIDTVTVTHKYFSFRHLQIEISEEEKAKGLRGWRMGTESASKIRLHCIQ